MNTTEKIAMLDKIRDRLLMNTSVSDSKYALEIARRWLKA